MDIVQTLRLAANGSVEGIVRIGMDAITGTIMSSMKRPVLRCIDLAGVVRDTPRRILCIARVAMSFVGIVYIWSFWRQLDFTWHGQPQWLGSVLCAALVAVLALRALGLGGWMMDRVLSVIHFVVAQYLLMRSYPYPTVNEGMYMMLAFWSMFIQLNPPKGQTIPAWAPLLLSINIAIVLHTSGLAKCGDRIWQDGTGFYHFLRLNWIRHPSADWLLAHTTALKVMNYAALGMEVGCLPLMFWRRTRPVAVAMIFGFFASLIYPFRMDMIGEVGLCVSLIALAGALIALRERQKLSGLDWALAFYMTIVGGCDLTHAWGDITSGIAQRTCWFIHDTLDGWYPQSARWVNDHATQLRDNVLFTSQHTIGICAFRILVTMPDGSTVEPIQVFNPDRTGGRDTQGFGCTRHYQSCIYNIGGFARDRYQRHDDIDVLLTHAVSKAGGVYAQLMVSPLDQSFDAWRVVHKLTPPQAALRENNAPWLLAGMLGASIALTRLTVSYGHAIKPRSGVPSIE